MKRVKNITRISLFAAVKGRLGRHLKKKSRDCMMLCMIKFREVTLNCT